MNTDRRSFLRLFGASTAAVATVEGIETVSSPTAPSEFSADIRQPFPDRYSRTARAGRDFDVRPASLYHRIDIEKNSMRDSYSGFSGAVGQPMSDGSSADWLVTNLQKPNQLVQPESFLVRRIGIVFSPKTNPALRSAFLDRYEMQFRIDQKAYWAGPLSFIFSTVGEPDRENGFTTLPDRGVVDIGEVPLILLDEVTFRAEIRGTPIQPCDKLKFWIVLEGLRARGIQ